MVQVDARDGSVSLSTKRLEQRPGDMLRNTTQKPEEKEDAAAAP